MILFCSKHQGVLLLEERVFCKWNIGFSLSLCLSLLKIHLASKNLCLLEIFLQHNNYYLKPYCHCYNAVECYQEFIMCFRVYCSYMYSKYCNLIGQLQGTIFRSALIQGTILIVPACFDSARMLRRQHTCTCCAI